MEMGNRPLPCRSPGAFQSPYGRPARRQQSIERSVDERAVEPGLASRLDENLDHPGVTELGDQGRAGCIVVNSTSAPVSCRSISESSAAGESTMQTVIVAIGLVLALAVL